MYFGGRAELKGKSLLEEVLCALSRLFESLPVLVDNLRLYKRGGT